MTAAHSSEPEQVSVAEVLRALCAGQHRMRELLLRHEAELLHAIGGSSSVVASRSTQSLDLVVQAIADSVALMEALSELAPTDHMLATKDLFASVALEFYPNLLCAEPLDSGPRDDTSVELFT